VRKIQRLAAVGAMAALTVALGACGGTESPTTTPEAPETTSEAAAPTSDAAAGGDGVTTNDDVFGSACSMLPQGDEPGSLDSMGPQPVASAAGTNPLLTTLATAVGEVPGLADTLNSQEAITVYAPSNGAFEEVKASLGEEAYNALLANPDELGALLSYHVVPQRYDAEGLIAAGTTMQLVGGEVTVSGTATDDGLKLTSSGGTEATVLCGNIPTSNATVFVIDKVLMPAAS